MHATSIFDTKGQFAKHAWIYHMFAFGAAYILTSFISLSSSFTEFPFPVTFISTKLFLYFNEFPFPVTFISTKLSSHYIRHL